MTMDVRSKTLLLIFSNVSFLMGISGILEWVLVAGIVFLLSRFRSLKIGFFYLCLFCLFWGLHQYIVDKLESWNLIFFSVLIFFVYSSLPTFMAASLLVGTTSSYELIHGFRKWHISESLLLSFAVMLRFFPLIREDFRDIHQALKMRGLFFYRRDILFHPVKYSEYILVPLLMNIMRRVEELTRASLTKGLVVNGRTSEAFPSKFGWMDWSVCVWIVLMFLCLINR